MPKRLTNSVVNGAAKRDSDYFLWDGDLKGFGLKVCSGGRKSYVCKYRLGTGRNAPTRRMTIGTHGSPWTPDQARKRAGQILGLVAHGEDPAQARQAEKSVLTVAQLCDRYLEHGAATKKASTLATDRGRIERHIKPLLGRMRVPDVKRAEVSRFLQDVAAGKTAVDVKTGARGRAIVRGGKGTATRTVGLLGGIFSFAVESGWISENPVRGVKRFRDRRNERFLVTSELQRLGAALIGAEAAGENPYAIAIIRLLVLTGARKGEIESLRWPEVDWQFSYLRLADSKTGQKLIMLNGAGIEVLQTVPRQNASDFVFPASRSDGYYEGTPKVWRRIREQAELQNVRLHDLRHSFASMAVSSGASLPVIGALLGHKDAATTSRYAHLQSDPVRVAAEATSASLAAALSSVGVAKNGKQF
ncbi:tyrosine-type recombinase/integrase [Hyphomonas chukchiensis]|uniref:tyrosine-type recombinase/integrase n=1 Tax=Hyphomonas chukchiensis TaxID=1280947 RepID=UPI0030F98CA8